MRDCRKTKTQLLEEIKGLRARVAELEGMRADHRRAERNLLRTVVDALPDYIYVKDTESRLVFGNKAVMQLCGVATPEEIVGKTDCDVFPRDVAAEYYKEEQGLLHTGQPIINQERRSDGPTGETSWALTTKVPLRDSEGRIVGLVGLNRDVTALKRAGERLWLLSAAVEQSSEGMAMSDPDGNLLFANGACAKMHQYAPQELIGRHLSVFHTPEQMPAVEAANRQIREKGSFSGEIWHRRRDGTVFPALMHNSILRDDAGDPIGMIATLRDITEVRQAEQTLREQIQRSEMIIDSAMDGFYSLDTDGRIHGPNPAFCAIVGYSREELEGMHLANLDVIETPEEIARHVEEILRVGGSRFETKHRRKDGRIVDLEISSRFAGLGERQMLFSFARDITARKAAELKTVRFTQAIENAAEGIGICDRHGRLTYANGALLGIFGCKSFEELGGRSWLSFLEGRERWWEKGPLPSIKKQGRWQGELAVRRPAGQGAPLAITLSRIGEAEDDFTVVAHIRDRTDEERHISQIRKMTLDANMILERERAIISRELHDALGQSLTAMTMSLGWLRRHRNASDTAVQERTSYCYDLACRMIDVVRDLSMSLRPPILDHQGLSDALRSHVAEFRRTTGIASRFRTEPPDLAVEDPFATITYRIMQEALTNVARHAHASRCSVDLRRVGDRLEMTIQDNGVGADSGTLASTSSLGVAGMKERASALGGTVEVENAKQGGLRVFMRLPLKELAEGTHHD